MNAAQYDAQFQAIGSIIDYSNDRATDITTLEAQMESIVAKMSNEFDVISNPLNSTISMVNNAVTSMNSQINLSKNVITNYLQNVTKVDLGSTGATVALVIDDLITDMVAQSETVLISGVFWSYFNTNYNKQLNSVPSGETIPDSWAE